MADDQCPVQLDFDEAFYPDRFQNTPPIKFWHLNAARYGHTADIQYLMDGTKEQQQDYLRGLLASSITIFSVAFIWCLFLWVFKCIGPYAAGFFSGRMIPLKAKPEREDYQEEERYEQQLQAWQQKYDSTVRTRSYFKCIVVLAGLGIVVSAILLSVKGTGNLIDTLNGMDKVVAVAEDLIQRGIDLIDSVVGTQEDVVNETQALLGNINELCPELRDPVCTDLKDPNSCNFEGIVQNPDAVVALLNFAVGAQEWVYDELLDSREDLVDMLQTAEDMRDFSDTFTWAFWASMAFSIVVALLCLCIVYSAFWPPTNSCRCIQYWCFVPLFVICVVLSWIFSLVFVIGSVGLADFCYNSPDENFKTLMSKLEDQFSPIIYKSILFYVSGCPMGLVSTEIVDFLKALPELLSTISDGIASLAAGGDFECDAGSRSAAVAVTNTVSNSVCEASELLVEFRTYLECENWYPLYEESMYNAMCYEGTDGFAWVTGTQIAMVLCSMVILSLRVVFYPIEIEERVDSQKSPLAAESKAMEGQLQDNESSAVAEHAPSTTEQAENIASSPVAEKDPSTTEPAREEAQILPAVDDLSSSSGGFIDEDEEEEVVDAHER